VDDSRKAGYDVLGWKSEMRNGVGQLSVLDKRLEVAVRGGYQHLMLKIEFRFRVLKAQRIREWGIEVRCSFLFNPKTCVPVTRCLSFL
jgi:hypothetical protein